MFAQIVSSVVEFCAKRNGLEIKPTPKPTTSIITTKATVKIFTIFFISPLAQIFDGYVFKLKHT
jgi:hypothetical protein